jgi:hypothetical protein
MLKRAPVFLTHVRHSIQSDSVAGATLPGFGFHQQTELLPLVRRTKTRFLSTAALCQSRRGLNSFTPRLMTILIRFQGFMPARSGAGLPSILSCARQQSRFKWCLHAESYLE